MGEPLPFQQKDIKINGWAMECRINAEDPYQDFRPSLGEIEQLQLPSGFGVRMDTHLFESYEIPSDYDSMIGKLLAHRGTRDKAIRTMLRALDEFAIDGVATTIPLQRVILEHSDFRAGSHDTGFVERYFAGNLAATALAQRTRRA